MTDFDIWVAVRDGCQLVSVAGDLDGDTAPRLERELDRLLERQRVIIDLNRVRSLTSAGVQALLRERSFGLPVLFCRSGSSVARVLEIVQAHRLVPIYSDLAAAIDAPPDGGFPVSEGQVTLGE